MLCMYLALSKLNPYLLNTINYEFFFESGLKFHLTIICPFLNHPWITFIITSRELSYFLPSSPILPASPAENVVVVELLTEVLLITPGASVLRGDEALTGRVGAGVVVVVVVLVVGTVTPENSSLRVCNSRIVQLTRRRVRTINDCGEHSHNLLMYILYFPKKQHSDICYPKSLKSVPFFFEQMQLSYLRKIILPAYCKFIDTNTWSFIISYINTSTIMFP